MPYTIKKNSAGAFCVAKKDTGEIVDNTCHAAKADAIKQMVAIMLSEEKARHAKMSQSTAKEREGMDASNFGDPANKLFPVMDQSDVDAAARLIGKAKNPDAVKARVIAIAKRKGFKIPEAWQSKNSSFSAEVRFDGEAWEDDEHIYRAGKIFESGVYEDKDFEMTEEELAAAAAAFDTAISLDLEHVPTPLDGKLGHLIAVDVAEDGKSLVGVTALPKWLDTVLADGERKVSATWDRATKTLQGLALVRSPRVTDAALMAEFARSRHDTPRGQMALQAMHDMATAHGAVCKAPSADMASRHEANKIQQMHDLAVDGGATCDSSSKGGMMPAYYSDTRPRPDIPAKRGKKMTLKERILALFGEAEDDEAGAGGEGAETKIETPPAKPEKPPSVPPAIAAQMRAMQDQLAAQEARFAEQTKRRIEAEAENFAETLLRDGKLLPPEKPALLAAFIQAAHDDTAHEAKVTFGVGKDGAALEGGRVDALKALFAARSPHVLFSELSSRPIPVGATVLMNREEGKQDAAAVRAEADQLLATTDLGRQVLAERVRQTNGKGG